MDGQVLQLAWKLLHVSSKMEGSRESIYFMVFTDSESSSGMSCLQESKTV